MHTGSREATQSPGMLVWSLGPLLTSPNLSLFLDSNKLLWKINLRTGSWVKTTKKKYSSYYTLNTFESFSSLSGNKMKTPKELQVCLFRIYLLLPLDVCFCNWVTQYSFIVSKHMGNSSQSSWRWTAGGMLFLPILNQFRARSFVRSFFLFARKSSKSFQSLTPLTFLKLLNTLTGLDLSLLI